MNVKIIYENHFWSGICGKKATSATIICVKCWDSCVVSDLRLLVTENPLKMVKYAFYFTLKARFVLKMFKFLFWRFGHVK